MGEATSSIASGMRAVGGIATGITDMFSGAGSIGRSLGGIYQDVNDFAAARLEEQAGLYEGEMAVIGANLTATQMELEASQMNAMSGSMRSIAKFKQAMWEERAGQIALSALFEEKDRREELEATLATQNAIMAANGGGGMSTIAFMSNSIDVAENDIAKMKLYAMAETNTAMRNARLERIQGDFEASVNDQRAANKRLEAQFTRFGGAMVKTATLLGSRARSARRGTTPSFFNTVDRWTSGSGLTQAPGFNAARTVSRFDTSTPSGVS